MGGYFFHNHVNKADNRNNKDAELIKTYRSYLLKEQGKDCTLPCFFLIILFSISFPCITVKYKKINHIIR